MQTVKTYSKGAPFYNAFHRTWLRSVRVRYKKLIEDKGHAL